MSDLGTILSEIAAVTHEPNEATVFKEILQDVLLKLRGKRFKFSCIVGATFNTVADQAEYVPGAGGVPSDIFGIDFMRITSGSRRTPIEQKTFSEIREAQWLGLRATEPRIFAWYGGQIHFWPTPSSIQEITLDYLSDATVDDSVGDEGEFDPSTSTTAFTNPYFRSAKHFLKWAVIVDYAMGRGDNPALAERAKIMYDQSEQALRRELANVELDGMQVPAEL